MVTITKKMRRGLPKLIAGAKQESTDVRLPVEDYTVHLSLADFNDAFNRITLNSIIDNASPEEIREWMRLSRKIFKVPS